MMPQSSPSHQPTSPVAPVNNVDESMQKALEDTELLKSIVLPLEEQIQVQTISHSSQNLFNFLGIFLT